MGQGLAVRGPEDAGDLLTPREVAEIFGVRTTTIARWSREGRLSPIRTPGGHRRYTRAEIRAVLDEDAAVTEQLSWEFAEDAVRLYAQGWSIRQVATRFEVSYGTMRRVLVRHSKLRNREAQTLSYDPEDRQNDQSDVPVRRKSQKG
jgi:excisionase family DNA binding protein